MTIWNYAAIGLAMGVTAAICVSIGFCGIGECPGTNQESALILVLAGLGGVIGGVAVAQLFGRSGWIGLQLALGGALLATWIGSLTASIGIILVNDTMIAAIARDALELSFAGLLLLIVIWPAGLMWIILMSGIHIMARRMRRDVPQKASV
ncbi:hypothetical protein AAD018_013685 [Aestuariibius insulae]|uniref:hypothetical protein n=1 Tax=Aestuariibius insulae TaxID=2058287 RepID=UPI00345E09D1